MSWSCKAVLGIMWMVSMAVNKTQFQRVRLVKSLVAVFRQYGGQAPTLRISVVLPISGADTSLCPAQAAITSHCCHLTLAVSHLCLYHTSCPRVVQLCNTDHTHTNYKPSVATGGDMQRRTLFYNIYHSFPTFLFQSHMCKYKCIISWTRNNALSDNSAKQ